jgi:hypothetical protein
MDSLGEPLRRRLQDHFSDGLVTVIGAGHSAALGIPGMDMLATELRDKLPALAGANLPEWEQVAERLGEGLEGALDALSDDSALTTPIVACTARFLSAMEKDVISQILSDERRIALAELLPHIAFAADAQVITTNYDRIIEIAVELAGLALDCSFPGAHACPFDPEASHAAMRSEIVKKGTNTWLRNRRHVRLWKPHGSLDWYTRADGSALRTPYRVGLAPLMITPGSSKYLRGYNPPFDRHREEANHAIDHAARLLCIGYGFNDPHLQTHMAPLIRAGTPTLMLTRTLSMAARELASAGAGVIAIERSQMGGTYIHTSDGRHELSNSELWTLDGFIDEVLK